MLYALIIHFFCLLIIDGMFITDLTNAIFKYDIIIVMQKTRKLDEVYKTNVVIFFYHINRTFLLLITVIKFK